MNSDYLNCDFKKVREEDRAKAKLEELEVFRCGPKLESTIPCMRWGCPETRWVVPGHGSVLCEWHTEEVLLGECAAPPLRRGRDYYSGARKTFLVETLPEQLK